MSCLFFACALAAEAQQAPPLERVSLQLKWKHQFQFAGYYAAIEKGFYRDAGLDVALLEPAPGKAYTDPVLEGAADFGVASSELVLLRAQGKPVVVLAPIYQHSPLVLLVSGKAGIDNVHELAGKQVMIAREEAELFAYFEAEGLDPGSLRVLPHQYNAELLAEHKIDAMSGYATDEPFRLRAMGSEFLMFNPRAGGIDFYGDTLFTTEAQITGRPERVKRFLDASLKGWQYALAHPDEIVDLIYTKYSQRHSKEHLKFEADESRKLIQPDLVELGYTNPGRWQSIAEAYTRLGMLSGAPDLSGFIHDRDPRPDYRWLFRALGLSLAAIAGIAALAFYFYRLNAINRKQAEKLQQALDAFNTLRGVLPICSYCKKIRDDQGAWNDLEHYIAEHSEAEFSHGICTDCYKKVRLDLEADRAAKSSAQDSGAGI